MIWLNQGDAQARTEALVGTRCPDNTRPDNDNVICLRHDDRYVEKEVYSPKLFGIYDQLIVASRSVCVCRHSGMIYFLIAALVVFNWAFDPGIDSNESCFY
jgi:hypothetical protein